MSLIVVLSLDTPLHVHFEGLLKQEEHQKRPQKFKSFKLLSQVKQRPQDSAKKVCQKLASSLLSSASKFHLSNFDSHMSVRGHSKGPPARLDKEYAICSLSPCFAVRYS